MSSEATRRPPKTLADLVALPDETRAELIDGEIYVTPSPLPRHQRAVVRLALLLESHLEATSSGVVLVAPSDVHLPTGDVVQPDVYVVRSGNPALREDGMHGVPDLVIEILSPSNPIHDRIVKRDLYARNGVPEYWIVDPDARSVEVFVIEGPAYRPAGYAAGEGTVRSPGLQDLEMRLRQIFA